MNENEFKIMKVTNISNFTFNGESGARFDGHDYLIEPGEALRAPFAVAEHLAKHLAQAILIRKAPIRDAKEIDGRGADEAIFNEANVKTLMARIMTEDGVVEKAAAPKSPGQIMKENVEALNKNIKTEGGEDGEDDGVKTSADGGYKDKAEVIAALKEKGIPHDAKKTKAELEALLK